MGSQDSDLEFSPKINVVSKTKANKSEDADARIMQSLFGVGTAPSVE
jgi:hypothetical protein